MKNKIKKIYNWFISKDLRLVPASLAYSFTLAIIPILSLVIYLLTTLNLSTNLLQKFLMDTFPVGVVNLLEPIFFSTNIDASSIITLGFGLVVATNGCNAIIVASNTIFNLENSSFLKRMIKSLVLAILITILLAFILIVPLLGRSIINFIGTFTSIISTYSKEINTLYLILQIPVSLIIIFFIVKLIYTIAPDSKIESKYVNKGALFTTVSWLIVTIGFSYYINNIANYDMVYGNLANIVMLLFWFYIMAIIFVFGLCLNKDTIEKRIDKTNTIKLEEIRKKIKEEQK